MIKYLTTHGNSSALVIDKPILELLNIDQKTALKVTTDGNVLIISPVRDKSREKKFKSIVKEMHKRHANTFRKLAE